MTIQLPSIPLGMVYVVDARACAELAAVLARLAPAPAVADLGPVTADELAAFSAQTPRNAPRQHGPQRKGRGGKIKRW